MAFDVLKPATTDNYVTQFTQGIRANLLALALGLDSVQSTFTGTIPTYAKRWNRSTGLWEEYNGTAWAPVPIGSVTTAGDITGASLTSYGVGGEGGSLLLRSTTGAAVAGRVFIGTDSTMHVRNQANFPLYLGTNGTVKVILDTAGYWFPVTNLVQDLGKSTNRWGAIYTRDISLLSRVSFYAASGTGYIESNDGNWGLAYKPSIDGAVGSHLWLSANGTYLASAKLVSGIGLFDVDTINTRTVNIATKFTLPSNGGVTHIVMGTGDAATYATHNTRLHLHNGLGIEDYSGTVRGVYDARTGVWDTKGGFRWDGNPVPNIYGFGASGNWNINITGTAAAANTVVTVGAAQVGNAIVALGVYDLGSHMMAKNFTGAAQGVGAVISGASLQAADGTGGASGSTMPGTWRLNGWCGPLGVSLWTRVA